MTFHSLPCHRNAKYAQYGNARQIVQRVLLYLLSHDPLHFLDKNHWSTHTLRSKRPLVFQLSVSRLVENEKESPYKDSVYISGLTS